MFIIEPQAGCSRESIQPKKIGKGRLMEERSPPGGFGVKAWKIDPVVGIYNSQRSTHSFHGCIEVSLHGNHSLLLDRHRRIDLPVIDKPESAYHPAIVSLRTRFHRDLLAQGVLFLLL